MNLKNKHVLAVYRALRVRLNDMRADPTVDGANAVIAESLYDLATEGNVLELYKLGRGLNQDVQKLRKAKEVADFDLLQWRLGAMEHFELPTTVQSLPEALDLVFKRYDALRAENEGLRKQLETQASEGATIGRFDVEVTAEKTTRKLRPRPAGLQCTRLTSKGKPCKIAAISTQKDTEGRVYCPTHWNEYLDRDDLGLE